MRKDLPEAEAPHAAFPGDGELARLTREKDWSTTDLGPVASWSQSLRSALSICLGSRFPIALYWGRTLTLLYNDAWSPILGNKHPWALGRPGREVWPEIWETIGPMFEGVMTTGESVYFEDALLAMRRHGYTEECYFNYSFAPVRGEGGRVEGVFNAVIETTFRVVSERRTRLLRELGERLAVSVSSSAEEICSVAVASLNEAAQDVPFCALYLGKRGQPQVRLVAVAGLPRGSSAVPEVIGSGEGASTWPWDEVRQAGTLRLVSGLEGRFGFRFPGGAWPEAGDSAVVAPLLEAGQVVGLLVMGVNPRRAFDDAYREFVERASSIISAAVANANAYEKERLRLEALAEASRAKDEFLAMLGHELRNPLAPILTALQVMGMRGSGVFQKERAIIDRQVRHMVGLVEDLLEVSRIARGKITLSLSTLDLDEVLAKAIEIASPLFEQRKHTLELEVGPELAVEGDLTRLAQVFANLLTNAAKYTPSGGTVTVAARKDESDVVVSVRDNGIGMHPEMLPRVFDLFTQERQALDRSQGGLGLGLAIVRSLVEAHGGQVSAHSGGPDHGSEFVVRIPAVEARPRVADPAPPALTKAEGTGRRILIVDDNEDGAEALADALLDLGHVIEMAHDGPAALAKIDSFLPEIAILDIGLPVMDGYELARRLREEGRVPGLQLIAVTGYGQASDKARALEAGFDAHLVKPVSLDLLERTIALNEHAVPVQKRAGGG